MIERAFGVFVAFACASTGLAQQGEAVVVRMRSMAPFVIPPSQQSQEIYTALPGDIPTEHHTGLDVAGMPGLDLWLVPVLERRHRAAIDAGRLSITLADAKTTGSPVASGSLVLRGRAVLR